MTKYSTVRIITFLSYIILLVIGFFFNNVTVMFFIAIGYSFIEIFITPHIKELKEKKKEENKIKSYFNEIRNFLGYLFSDEYKNHNPQTSNNDERLIVDLSILKDKEKELKKYFCFMIRKDDPTKHKKQLSIKRGKWMIHFRIHKPFEATLYLSEKLIEETKIAQSIELLLNDMKDYTKEKFKKFKKTF